MLETLDDQLLKHIPSKLCQCGEIDLQHAAHLDGSFHRLLVLVQVNTARRKVRIHIE